MAEAHAAGFGHAQLAVHPMPSWDGSESNRTSWSCVLLATGSPTKLALSAEEVDDLISGHMDMGLQYYSGRIHHTALVPTTDAAASGALEDNHDVDKAEL